MKNLRILASLTFIVSVFAFPMISRAGIVIDYTGDTFFASNPVAMAALEAAAADINAAIDFSCLDGISNDVISGAGGGSFVNFSFEKTYLNPADGMSTQVLKTQGQNTQIVPGQVNIFAGARDLGANTLGIGSSGGTAVGISVFDAGGGSFPLAVADALTREQHSRGSGPVIANANGTVLGGAYSFDQGIHTGSVAFNDATNWHFDHTTAVTAGLNDFYSVALHELLHTIGFGISDSWNSVISGTNYLGTEGIAANGGSGTGLVNPAGSHLAMGIVSPRISDGVLQEVVMDPDITVGTRKFLTELDLAVMRDLGLKTIDVSAVPEPSSLVFLALGGVALCGRRRKLAL